MSWTENLTAREEPAGIMVCASIWPQGEDYENIPVKKPQKLETRNFQKKPKEFCSFQYLNMLEVRLQVLCLMGRRLNQHQLLGINEGQNHQKQSGVFMLCHGLCCCPGRLQEGPGRVCTHPLLCASCLSTYLGRFPVLHWHRFGRWDTATGSSAH